MRLRHTLLTLIALAAGSVAVAGDDDALVNLAKALVEKRSAVERLSTEVDLAKAAQSDEQRARHQQRADLQRQLKALEVELGDLEAAAGEHEAELARRAEAREALVPVVERGIERASGYVQGGLPFKIEARTGELTGLRVQLEAGQLTPHEALGRLWSALEDELRLTRENGLYRQTIEMAGETQLADVVKLGMALLYVKTQDGRFGVAVRTEQGWRYRPFDDREDARRVAALFEALEKNVRQGYFELPVPAEALRAEESQ